MSDAAAHNRWVKLGLLAVIGVVGLAVAWWWYRAHGGDLRAMVDAGVARLRELGPGVFFLAMAVLPALGCPLTFFTLPAGSVFAPTLGMPLVLVLVCVSLGINLALTYWLARYALRPWLEKLCAWLGYKLPQVSAGNQRGLVVLVRVTPGPPYVLQSYLLGLAGVAFAPYFIISWVIQAVYACAMVMFGDAIINGQGRMVFISMAVFAAATLGVQLLRRRYRKKPAAA